MKKKLCEKTPGDRRGLVGLGEGEFSSLVGVQDKSKGPLWRALEAQLGQGASLIC